VTAKPMSLPHGAASARAREMVRENPTATIAEIMLATGLSREGARKALLSSGTPGRPPATGSAIVSAAKRAARKSPVARELERRIARVLRAHSWHRLSVAEDRAEVTGALATALSRPERPRKD